MKAILIKIQHLMQRLLEQAILFPKYVKNFGFKVAIYLVLDRLFPPGRSRKYRKVVYQYLDKQFQDISRNYNNQFDEHTDKYTNRAEKIIWVCWFQGEEKMPELVKMCYENLKEQIADCDIQLILLTCDNIHKYLNIPQYIAKKYQQGIISHAHYSDILRIKLLKEYGGCWIDSTVFVTQPITNKLFHRPFNTLKMPPENCPLEPCLGLWSGFFLVAQSNSTLFQMLDEYLDKYWIQHDVIIDYVIIDYLMLVVYRNNIEVKTTMDRVPYNNENLWFLWNNMERPYSETLMNEICHTGQFYKLSYQKELLKQNEGKLTIYGYLSSKWNPISK